MTPDVPFPRSRRRQAWERIIARLFAPGTPLLAYFKTIEVYQGRAGETQPWEDIARMPAIRITPRGGRMRVSAENQHQGALTLDIEIGIPGTNAGNLMDVWSAIEAQLFTPDQSLLNELQDFGVYSPSIGEQAITPKEIGAARALALHGSGTLEFRMTHNA